MGRQLTAIMFTDMVGFTALMQRDERRAREARDRQRRVQTGRIEAHGGEIVQYYGDGTLSIFRSALDAVEAGLEVQADLREPPPVDLRIGIHTGDVVRDEHGVFGDGVNVAARIQGLCGPGGILISGKVHDEIKNHPHIETLPLGEVSLKNVQRPMDVLAVVNEGLRVPSPGEFVVRGARECRSVAVLPFTNMSADPENEFFADGISEEIINALTRINGLKVTARTSSFAFKNRSEDIRKIAAELGVTTILEGSVRRDGERVRINAQLVDARDGYHLFSRVYDRTLESVFETQDEIARAIVRELEDHFEGGERRLSASYAGERPIRLVRSHGYGDEAHNEYLRGLFHWGQWTPEGVRRGIRHFERSITLDPSSSLPHAALALSYVYLGALGHLPPAEAYARAREAAGAALELEEDVGESHLALATVRFFHDWDFSGAYESFQKALSLNPGAAVVHLLYGLYLRATGEMDDAVEELETAVKLDPFSLAANSYLAQIHIVQNRLDEAEELIDRALELDPSFYLAVESQGWMEVRRGDLEVALAIFEEYRRRTGGRHPMAGPIGYVHARLGREEQAVAMEALVEEREESQPGTSLSIDRALVRLGLGDHDGAVEWLGRAADQRLGQVVFLESHWLWDDLRDHPGYRALVRRIGLPETLAAA